MTLAGLLEKHGLPQEDAVLFGANGDLSVTDRNVEVNPAMLFTRLDAWAWDGEAVWISWINANGANYARIAPLTERERIIALRTENRTGGPPHPRTVYGCRVMCGASFEKAFADAPDRFRLDNAYQAVEARCARMTTRLRADHPVLVDKTSPPDQSCSWREVRHRISLLARVDDKGRDAISAVFTIDRGHQYPRDAFVGAFDKESWLVDNLCDHVTGGKMSFVWEDHLVRPNSYHTSQSFKCDGRRASFHICGKLFKQCVGNRELVGITPARNHTQLVSRYKSGGVVLSTLEARTGVRQDGLLSAGRPDIVLEALAGSERAMIWKEGLTKAEAQDIVNKLEIRHAIQSIAGGD